MILLLVVVDGSVVVLFSVVVVPSVVPSELIKLINNYRSK